MAVCLSALATRSGSLWYRSMILGIPRPGQVSLAAKLWCAMKRGSRGAGMLSYSGELTGALFFYQASWYVSVTIFFIARG